jgi:hypothetical protein
MARTPNRTIEKPKKLNATFRANAPLAHGCRVSVRIVPVRYRNTMA